jgi:hypothetical protein
VFWIVAVCIRITSPAISFVIEENGLLRILLLL